MSITMASIKRRFLPIAVCTAVTVLILLNAQRTRNVKYLSLTRDAPRTAKEAIPSVKIVPEREEKTEVEAPLVETNTSEEVLKVTDVFEEGDRGDATSKDENVQLQNVVYSTKIKVIKNITEEAKKQNDKLTVVITTYKQPTCLERMILQLRSCPIVAEIRVNWFEQNVEPILYNNSTDQFKPVIFDKYPDKLSYRFHPRNFRTNAVFSVDVDVFYSCDSLQKTFETWQQDENSAVGYHGRYLRDKDPFYIWDTSYAAPEYLYNTLFVTKGAITHKSLFDEYFKDEYTYLRDLIDDAITAEDLLMSFLLDKLNVKIIMTCPKVDAICHVKCNQNKVESLNKRTSSSRQDLIQKFFQHFGQNNVFQHEMKGSENVVWQGGYPQKECMTKNRKEYENTPHCVNFCRKNLICPSNVK